ncbi:MAG: hypothetical protein ABIW79_06070 [Gemmatimonas sp.]
MTARDPDDDASPAEPGSDAEQKPVDLRFTKVEQSGVRLDRDLSGQGHLARGSRTNMSNMRFSVRAQPRDELDPELQALRPAEPPTPPPPPRPAPQPRNDEAPKEEQPSGGMFAAIKRLFE